MPFSFFHNNPKLRKTVEFSIKLAILLLLFASLYWQIARRDDISLVFSDIVSAFDRNIYLIMLVFGLMFANWGLEAAKWPILLAIIVSSCCPSGAPYRVSPLARST